MRNAVGIFGAVCGAVVVALVARYGYRTTDVEIDALIMAFMFGVIATAGLGGHAMAARLLGMNRRPLAIGVATISAVALMLNLGNSLGAIAGRQDKSTMERVEKNRSIRAAEAELKRLTARRDAMSSTSKGRPSPSCFGYPTARRTSHPWRSSSVWPSLWS